MGLDTEFWLAMLGVAGVSGLATALVLRQAPRLGLLHAPNNRSSHVRPTPHGGGVGIVLGGTLAAFWAGTDAFGPYWLAIPMSLVIAVLGLRDDIRHVPAPVRLAVQAACLTATLALAGPGGATVLLLLLAGVWWVNLFNFMDGIDGLAASQALFMLLAAAGLAIAVQPDALTQPLLHGMLWLAAATAAFLLWNWPPARIFMGDVGSTYLAFLLFFIALATIRADWLSPPAWLILGALFITDATHTLLRRIVRGARWWEAHREHAYQRLARRWGGHRPVTLLALSINLLYLLPLAYLALRWPELAWGSAALAYLPLAWAAARSAPGA